MELDLGWKKGEVLNAEEQKEKLCPNLPAKLWNFEGASGFKLPETTLTVMH